LCSGEKLFLFIIFVTGDRMSVSSTTSTSSLPDMQSPKQLNEGKYFVFESGEVKTCTDVEIFFTVKETGRYNQIQHFVVCTP